MKKFLLLTLVTISLFGIVNAQNKKDYYTGKTEVKGDKYTYSVEISPYSTKIFLHNNNSLKRKWTIMDDRGRLVGGLSVFGNVMKIEDVAAVKEAIKEALFMAYDKGEDINTDWVEKAIMKTYPLSRTMKEKIEAMRKWAEARAVFASGDKNKKEEISEDISVINKLDNLLI